MLGVAMEQKIVFKEHSVGRWTFGYTVARSIYGKVGLCHQSRESTRLRLSLLTLNLRIGAQTASTMTIVTNLLCRPKVQRALMIPEDPKQSCEHRKMRCRPVPTSIQVLVRITAGSLSLGIRWHT